MTTAIRLATLDDKAPLLALMARAVEEAGHASDPELHDRAVAPLLENGPYGAVWLVGPQRAPLGYVVVTFSWSVTTAETEGWVQEVYIRPSVRNRGIGTEVLHAVAVALGKGGVGALHVHLPQDQDGLRRFCEKVGFRAQDDILVLTDRL